MRPLDRGGVDVAPPRCCPPVAVAVLTEPHPVSAPLGGRRLLSPRHPARDAQAAGERPHPESRAGQVRRRPDARCSLSHHRWPHARAPPPPQPPDAPPRFEGTPTSDGHQFGPGNRRVFRVDRNPRNSGRLERCVAVCEPNSDRFRCSAPKIARQSQPAKFRFPDHEMERPDLRLRVRQIERGGRIAVEPLAEHPEQVNFPAPGEGESGRVRQVRSCSRRRE